MTPTTSSFSVVMLMICNFRQRTLICILKSLNDLIWFNGLMIFIIFTHFIRSHPLAKKLILNLVLREGDIKETL